MNKPPLPLTDRDALKRHRARVQEDAMFLHHAAIDDVQDRLSEVNKSFSDIAIVTGQPALWAAAFPDAKLIADDDTLDLQVDAHDLVIHAMALHWANDPVGQLIQCRRALRPDGLLMVHSFGGQTLQELRIALATAESKLRGGLSPRVAPMAEIRDLGALLQRAGLALPVADAMTLTATYESLPKLMHDLRHMGEANALAARPRSFAPKALFTAAATSYASEFALPDGRLPATFELICLTGWAPDESQQKPLRPGSATARLADALNTAERPLPDAAGKG